MAKPSLLFNPKMQFFLSTGAVAAGAKLFIYSPGTTTKQNTYTTSALSVANPNPITLDSGGYPANSGSPIDIYVTGSVKLVLAPSTDSDPPVAAYWTEDNVTTLGQLVSTVSKTANYTVLLTDRDKLITCDASSGNITLTLPSAATCGSGFNLKIKKTDSSSNSVIVDGNASETIDSATTLTTTQQNAFLEIWCDGTQWWTTQRATSNFITQTVEVFTSSGTFNVPAGVSSVCVQCWGPGGGGGATNSASISGGAGGGGAYAEGHATVTPSGTVTVTIGAGGAGGAAGASNNGSAGSAATSFGASIIAAAGSGGTGGAAGAGGAGGTVAGSTGTVKLAGMAGSAATSADWPYSMGGASPMIGLGTPAATGAVVANSGSGGAGGNNGTAGGTGAAGLCIVKYYTGNVSSWS